MSSLLGGQAEDLNSPAILGSQKSPWHSQPEVVGAEWILLLLLAAKVSLVPKPDWTLPSKCILQLFSLLPESIPIATIYWVLCIVFRFLS